MAALDIGEVRTGVALSDKGRVLASPLEVVPAAELAGYLDALLEEHAVSEVVVGVPKTLGGEVGFQARRVLYTLDKLKERFPGVRFVEWDERLTTRVAGGARKNKKSRRRAPVDHLAAAGMLQEYLARRGASETLR